jgi:protein-S-isoprenylcysteine O-methyltransferase Ste14
LAIAGLLFAISAFLAFQKAHTTVSPVAIDQASSLVTSGPFAISRNPMYLGLALVLLGWAIGLGAATALAGPVLFVIFVTIFQIGPEERVLREKFGDAYADYCKRVRRWI